jgi:NAD-dependent dihydropyrimidine dehydrogenase PreA subunit
MAGAVGAIRKARIIDQDACIECGACALNCPQSGNRAELRMLWVKHAR